MPKTEHHSEWTPIALAHFSVWQIVDGVKARYPAASDFVFQYEGGYVNDKDDPGGCTNMGITIGTLEGWRGAELTCTDVANLTKQEASLIYATNYWAPVWGNQLPVGLNTQVYDFGVNAGPSRAIKYLQGCVGTAQDGIMGPATLAAVEEQMSDALLHEYHDQRQAYYESLSTFSKYGAGWTSRNDDCLSLSLDLANNTPVIPTGVGDIGVRLAALERWASSFEKG